MGNMQQYHISISAPNLINICVDEQSSGEICGRLYHCYSEEAVRFLNVIELLREMENLFDVIGFPQASTKTRSFIKHFRQGSVPLDKPEKKVSPESMVQWRGEKGTFITSVRFRQNSTWQGELFWVEKELVQKFSNTLEFIKLIDGNLSK